MNPRISPQIPGLDNTYDTSTGAALPLPPPRDVYGNSHGGRHAGRPLSLITALPSTHPQLHDSTPLTTTSLSSPFVVNNSMTRAVSAGGSGPASRGVSPASNRMSGHFNVPYNPRQWSSGTPDIHEAQSQAAAEDGLSSPPPPYTTPACNTSNARSNNALHGGQHQPQSSNLHPAAGSSRNATPVNHRMISTDSNSNLPGYNPATLQQGKQPYDPRRHTNAHHNISLDANQQPLSFMSNRNTQDASGPSNPSAATRVYRPHVSYLSSSNEAKISSGGASVGRYSTSEGLLVRDETRHQAGETTSSRTGGSNRRKWIPGMPLPGPPPGLPPSSARSESTGSIPERVIDHTGYRHSSAQLPLRDTNRPISSSGLSEHPGSRRPRSGPPISLRIDTGINTQASASTRPMNPTEPVANVAAPNNANLGRKLAVRDPASRIIRERHNRSLSRGSAKESAVSVSTNPWAEALEKSSTPIGQALPLNQTELVGREGKQPAGRLRQSHTPPSTPFTGLSRVADEGPNDMPNTKVLPTPPLSQKPLLSAGSALPSSGSAVGMSLANNDFVSEALQRCADFLEEERLANTDVERLQLFANFIHEESLIRKEKYWTAYQSGKFDAAVAKEGLFDGVSRRRASLRDSRILAETVVSPGPSSASSIQQQQQQQPQQRPETMWWKDYRPQLSPIASMGYDEMSSRGRAPSRWFESQTRSQSEDAERKTQRSKRESKYMSLSKQLLKTMEQESLEPLPETIPHSGDFYPEEKAEPSSFGFYEGETISAPNTGREKSFASLSLLDISRFVTLPPPYPRHFPAVNNSHPDLAEYRNTVRALSDLHEVRERQKRHQVSTDAIRNEKKNQMAETRRLFTSNIRSQLDEGIITYAEAAEAEQNFKDEEFATEKRNLQAEFDMLQDVVVNPLHDQLNGRLTKLTASLESLEESLFTSAQNQDPDLPVQEGDDIPELLEQLTQYKWLFEARENIHFELFQLLSQRNNAYKAIVALPYKQANNLDKARDTEAFFENDAARRYAVFCTESRQRHRSFLETLNEHAQRGVQMQSSAFWDIAPNLLDLLDKIPQDLKSVDIHIPDEEYEENPTYRQFPQQYLYSLLSHANRATYQYIEAQINLLCLVHEVKSGELAARHRVQQAQASLGHGNVEDIEHTKTKEEGVLNDELKTRASLIEEQWHDALGNKLAKTQADVRRFLEDRGAWIDLDDDDNHVAEVEVLGRV